MKSLWFNRKLTQQRLKELFTYEPETGNFIRNITTGNRGIKGTIAGYRYKEGYIVIGINGSEYPVHKLVWLYMTGDLPILKIDHIDRNKANNKWTNLRLASNLQNNHNKVYKVGAFGVRGVSYYRNGKWRASICINYKSKYLGTFSSKEAAEQAYLRARELYFGEFNPKSLRDEIDINYNVLELDI